MRLSPCHLTFAPFCLLLLCMSAFATDPADGASPTVAALIQVCDRAAAQGNRGVDAAMCEWYSVPCACKPRGSGTDTWCVPEAEDIDATVGKVLAELRRAADPLAPADLAVAQALARLYPCTTDR